MARSATRVVGLRCEYQNDPVGVDVSHPRFSWRVESERRGCRPVAYRLTVHSSLEAKWSGLADVWDSGRIETPQTTNVRYSGPKLANFRQYIWTVTVWDDVQMECHPAEPGRFVTGAIDAWDAGVQWITMPDPTEYESTYDLMRRQAHTEYYAAYFRKEFSCDRQVVSAYAAISATGVCELWMNGTKVGNRILDPATTDFANDTLYSCYDVTQQVAEDNCLGVILGNGRCLKLYDYDRPAAFVSLNITYDDGSVLSVSSDSSWKVSHGPIRENGIYLGEHYDARLEENRWSLPGWEENDWVAASAVERPLPRWQAVDPIEVDRALSATSIWSPSPGVYVFDFGQNISGFVRMTVRGPRGTEVTLRHAELLDDVGGINTSTNRHAAATDVYILRGEGKEIYQPRFTYHGFRYAEVSGFPGVPTAESLVAMFAHSGVDRVGSFNCSSDLVNQVHQNVVWGQLSNLFGIPTDCPQRAERQGWLGDIQLAVEETIFNFDMARFLEKYLKDIRTSQYPDGGLSSVVPRYWSFHPADPAWGTAYITLVWAVYWYYGDDQIVRDHYEPLKRYIDHLDSMAEDGIIGYCSDYLFGDWCPPGSILPKRTPMELTSTWYYYHDTLLFSRAASLIDQGGDAKKYADRAEKIKAAFNERFLGENGYAVNKMGPWEQVPGQTSNLLPLYLDMVPPDRRSEILGMLTESVAHHHDDHLDTGIVGTRYLFDVLTDNGHADTAYRVATRASYPGWGYMIKEGATTLWERWEKLEGSGMNSQNHVMLGSIDAWFYRSIAGIRATEAGWKRLEIRPHLMGDLTYGAGSIDTPLGSVTVSWEAIGQNFLCRVSIPPGSVATVSLPVPDSKYEIIEGGVVIPVNRGEIGAGRYCIEIESGDYSFEVRCVEEKVDGNTHSAAD